MRSFKREAGWSLEMRIIAGEFKGMKLKSPKGDDTRPTSGRAREAIFSSLQFKLPGAVVLDLFSGSGAMGIEAASRGASRVIFNDSSKEAARLIAENCAKAKLSAEIYNLDYKQLLKKLAAEETKLDIVFLDPPYANRYGEGAIKIILKEGLMNPGGVIVHEHLTGNEFDYPEGVEVKSKRYCIAAVDFLYINSKI